MVILDCAMAVSQPIACGNFITEFVNEEMEETWIVLGTIDNLVGTLH